MGDTVVKRIWFIAIILLAGCGSSSTTVTRDVSPIAPTNIAGAAVSEGVQVSWSPSPTPGVSGYRVYRGTSPSSLSLIGVSDETSYTDSTIQPGNTYYYSVTAVKAGTESADSDQLIWGT